MATLTTENMQKMADVFRLEKLTTDNFLSVQDVADRCGEPVADVKRFCEYSTERGKLIWMMGADKYKLNE
jgi:hypothetical protein